MRSTSKSLTDDLRQAMVTTIVPIIADGLIASWAGQPWPMFERAVRSWSVRLLFERCVAARGLCLPERLGIDQQPLDNAVRKRADALLDELQTEWSQVTARTLGDLYEALLGYRIVVEEGRCALVADRRGRKASGSFYTPQPIVDQIVARTVRPLLDQRAALPPDDLGNGLLDLHILDPAMGSGHFLLAAVDFITGWLIRRGADDLPTLRQRVLEQSIYGVDNDPEAVEVARLCLWLHCATPGWPLAACEHHLRCGNSLVGQLFDDTIPPTSVFASGEKQKNGTEPSFNWPLAFPEVARQGGFAGVVGNPPYKTHFTVDERRAVLGWTRSRGRELEAAYLFVERSLALIRRGGRCGMIIPNVFCMQHDSAPFRHFLLGYTVERLVDYGFAAFGAATVPTAILVVQATPAPPEHRIEVVRGDKAAHMVAQATFAALPDAQFNPRLAAFLPILRSIEMVSAPLETFATSHEGIHSGNIRHKLFTRNPGDPRARPLLKGSDIERYRLHWGGWYVRYDRTLVQRQAGEYASLRDERLFTEPKLWTRQTGDQLIATWDETGLYADNTLHATQLRPDCPLSPLYLLALLNSRLLTAIYQTLTGERGRALAQVKLVFLRRLPIRRIAFTTPLEKREQLLAHGIACFFAAEHGANPEAKRATTLAVVGQWLQQGYEDAVHDLLAWLARRMLTTLEPEERAIVDALIDRIVERLYGIEGVERG